ncbi:hypothetical protein NQ317_011994 [Molorchus minor]|uniref:Retrotransposon gag domain-containing protein n=1 Tax=Molorchus minor TaxID=1323400 RepID=A0ABQ9JB45_9CUCU|nr:hypothetical protein NQ317_011994 [Molorchus minor]
MVDNNAVGGMTPRNTGDEQQTPMQNQPQSFTVEDLIEATVRAVMVYDGQRTQGNVPVAPAHPGGNLGLGPLTQQTTPPRFYSNKEIAALIPEFTGSNLNVKIWLERVESVQRVYKVPDEVIQLLAVGKLTQQAKDWYQSKVEFIEMPWDVLKEEIRKMYGVCSDPVTLRRIMEKRRWRKNEKFGSYFHDKVLLGNNAEVLSEAEFCINNTVNRSTGETPSKLLFGRNQLGNIDDNLRLALQSIIGNESENLELLREKASVSIERVQNENKMYYDKRHKEAHVYNVGEYVMVANVDTTPGVNKKLISKYRGPYVIKSILPNDRYVVTDIIGFQNTQMPYDGVLDASRLKPYNVSV